MAHGKKTGGRRAGTPNKTSKELREQLQSILQTTIEELPDTLAAMEPTDRAKILTALLPYIMPKMSTVDIKAEVETSVKVKAPWLTQLDNMADEANPQNSFI